MRPTHPLNTRGRALAIAEGAPSIRRPLSQSFEDVPTNDRRTDATSPLFDFLIPLIQVTTRFHRIAVPDALPFDANLAAFFPLRTWIAPHDCIFFGARWQICAADKVDIPASNVIKWADITGSAAAFVAIKKDLLVGTWTSEKITLPGMCFSQGTNAPQETIVEPAGGGPEYLWHQHIPPGDFGAAAGAPMISGSYSTLPAGQLVRRGEPICIGLATDPGPINNLFIGGDIRGRAVINLYFASEWGINRRRW